MNPSDIRQAKEVFLYEYCVKTVTCQAFRANADVRCGNHKSVEEKCKAFYLHLVDFVSL